MLNEWIENDSLNSASLQTFFLFSFLVSRFVISTIENPWTMNDWTPIKKDGILYKFRWFFSRHLLKCDQISTGRVFKICINIYLWMHFSMMRMNLIVCAFLMRAIERCVTKSTEWMHRNKIIGFVIFSPKKKTTELEQLRSCLMPWFCYLDLNFIGTKINSHAFIHQSNKIRRISETHENMTEMSVDRIESILILYIQFLFIRFIFLFTPFHFMTMIVIRDAPLLLVLSAVDIWCRI